MSMKRAITTSAWQRDEHGPYKAELHGWTLEVSWTPETPDARGFFKWHATRDERRHDAAAEFEEMNDAMLAAEVFAEHEPPKPADEPGTSSEEPQA
ncbi:MAG: hypothetical protein HY908_16995 [Myxococcales bacterium]|nr:hypothetical protein [Myxococcales bacterium]